MKALWKVLQKIKLCDGVMWHDAPKQPLELFNFYKRIHEGKNISVQKIRVLLVLSK